MRIQSLVTGTIGLVSLLSGFLLLISPYPYNVGGGCIIDPQGARLCSLLAPEINYPLLASGLILTILGTLGMQSSCIEGGGERIFKSRTRN